MADKTIAQKMFIKPGQHVLLVNAPKGMKEMLGFVEGVKVVTKSAGPVDIQIVFTTTHAELIKRIEIAKPLMKPGGLIWLAYPKAGQLDTDLKRDSVAADAKAFGLQPAAQIAIDEVWSALRFKAG